MILIADAGSRKRGNFAGAILTGDARSTMAEILIADMGFAKRGSSMIVGAEASAVRVVDGDKNRMKLRAGGRAASFFVLRRKIFWLSGLFIVQLHS
jgi:hypothetical protein